MEKAHIGIGYPRFDSKLRVEVLVPQLGPCWLWTGYTTPEGYGELRMGGRAGRTRKAHLVAYEELVGERPKGKQLDHTCHTEDKDCPGGPSCPHRACCNPGHLEPVTPGENSRRSRKTGSKRTHCPHGHAYTADNVYISTVGAQVCKTCTLSKLEARRRAAGAKPPKLTPTQRQEIRDMAAVTQRTKVEIARMYGVTPAYIGQLQKGYMTP